MATRRRKKEEVEEVDDFPEVTPRYQSKYAEAAGKIEGWAPASEVIDVVSSVRTCFPDFNRATTTGGLPVRRLHTVFGETHGGKSAFVLGLVRSFADVGYLAGYIDAEHSLERSFVSNLVTDLNQRPNFLARRPRTYEETIDAAGRFLNKSIEVGKRYPDHRCILVVDTINKLVPENELKRLLKEGGKELAKGHQGMLRAALNQAWLDQLTPLIYKAECSLVLVTQERIEKSSEFGKPDTHKPKGGQALTFDASIVARVSKGYPVFLGQEKKNDQICGFAHRVRITKSKVGRMDGRYTDCAFHTSNGRLVPAGLDIARDAVLVGKRLGLVKGDGWLTVGRKRYQGINRAVKGLSEDSETLGMLLDSIATELDKQEGRSQ